MSTFISGLNATIIYPATEKLIQKYASQVIHIVEETPALYDSLTLPHILKTQNSLEVRIVVLIIIEPTSLLEARICFFNMKLIIFSQIECQSSYFHIHQKLQESTLTFYEFKATIESLNSFN